MLPRWSIEDMDFGLDPPTLLLGILVFLARVADGAMGTMRTISIVQGRTRIAFGHMVLRIITPRAGKEMAEKVRNAGFGVTTSQGEGLSGPVTMLYVV